MCLRRVAQAATSPAPGERGSAFSEGVEDLFEIGWLAIGNGFIPLAVLFEAAARSRTCTPLSCSRSCPLPRGGCWVGNVSVQRTRAQAARLGRRFRVKPVEKTRPRVSLRLACRVYDAGLTAGAAAFDFVVNCVAPVQGMPLCKG